MTVNEVASAFAQMVADGFGPQTVVAESHDGATQTQLDAIILAKGENDYVPASPGTPAIAKIILHG